MSAGKERPGFNLAMINTAELKAAGMSSIFGAGGFLCIKIGLEKGDYNTLMSGIAMVAVSTPFTAAFLVDGILSGFKKSNYDPDIPYNDDIFLFK